MYCCIIINEINNIIIIFALNSCGFSFDYTAGDDEKKANTRNHNNGGGTCARGDGGDDDLEDDDDDPTNNTRRRRRPPFTDTTRRVSTPRVRSVTTGDRCAATNGARRWIPQRRRYRRRPPVPRTLLPSTGGGDGGHDGPRTILFVAPLSSRRWFIFYFFFPRFFFSPFSARPFPLTQPPVPVFLFSHTHTHINHSANRRRQGDFGRRAAAHPLRPPIRHHRRVYIPTCIFDRTERAFSGFFPAPARIPTLSRYRRYAPIEPRLRPPVR